MKILEKVEDISVREDLLRRLPPLINLNLMPPPGATVSKTNPNIIKEPTFATENSVAVESIGSADNVYY